jgi:hypothetical protein
MHLKDILCKAKGDRLDRVTQIRWFLRPSEGEADPFYWRPRASKLAQRRLSGSSSLRSDGSRDSQAGCWSV